MGDETITEGLKIDRGTLLKSNLPSPIENLNIKEWKILLVEIEICEKKSYLAGRAQKHRSSVTSIRYGYSSVAIFICHPGRAL